MFMKLVTNTLLCLTLTRLIIELKFRLKCGFFTKQTDKKKFFFQTNLELFIKRKTLFIYNPSIYLFNKLKIYIHLLLRITTPTPSV